MRKERKRRDYRDAAEDSLELARVLAGQGSISDQDFLERMARSDDIVDHDGETCGMGHNIILGAEVARAYKPQPEAYDCAARMLRLAPSECLMVAAHPSDLAAAAERGFRTAYVHRPLERGPGREPKRPDPGTFDFQAEDFLQLAEMLGA